MEETTPNAEFGTRIESVLALKMLNVMVSHYSSASSAVVVMDKKVLMKSQWLVKFVMSTSPAGPIGNSRTSMTQPQAVSTLRVSITKMEPYRPTR
jgi:hypothetical protein